MTELKVGHQASPSYTYRLRSLEFNDGTVIQPGPLTLLIGPNNAGKSRALKDIAAIVTHGEPQRTIVVRNVDWAMPPTLEALRQSYNVERYLDEDGKWQFRTLDTDLSREYHVSGGNWPTAHEIWLTSPNEPSRQMFAEHFGRAMVALLTTEHRLQLVKEGRSPEHEKQTASVLQSLYFAGAATEKSIRELVKQAFRREIALDFTVPQRLQIRVGEDFSEVPPDPRDARKLLSMQERLDDQGDGIRSFVGVLVAMRALQRSVILLDEPESFLHPPQAFRIGEFLAESAAEGQQIIIATHSVDVLRGILARTRDVTILRIDRPGGSNEFRKLDPAQLTDLLGDPLLSSARVLDGLFYSGAIVVEGDADARFYEAVSRKCLPESGFHFVNADNKQTVPRITGLYRSMGVRCAGVVDFDVLNKREEFERQLDSLALALPRVIEALEARDAIAEAAGESPADDRLCEVERQLTDLSGRIASLKQRQFASDRDALSAREKLLQDIERRSRALAESTKSWSRFKKDGREALPPDARLKFDELAVLCAREGLFINPCGELESMLNSSGVPHTTDKRSWIRQALKLLPNLLVDEETQPWKFMRSIQRHILGETEQMPPNPDAGDAR